MGTHKITQSEHVLSLRVFLFSERKATTSASSHSCTNQALPCLVFVIRQDYVQGGMAADLCSLYRACSPVSPRGSVLC